MSHTYSLETDYTDEFTGCMSTSLALDSLFRAASATTELPLTPRRLMSDYEVTLVNDNSK